MNRLQSFLLVMLAAMAGLLTSCAPKAHTAPNDPVYSTLMKNRDAGEASR